MVDIVGLTQVQIIFLFDYVQKNERISVVFEWNLVHILPQQFTVSISHRTTN